VNKRVPHIISSPSSACTGEQSRSGIFENSFETCNWTCKFYQGTGSCFQSVLNWVKRGIDWSSTLNALFQVNMLQLWLFQILVWIGRRVSNAVEAHILSYYTFSKYLSVWGKVLLNDNHKTKHPSQLIPKDGMRVSFNYSSQNLRYCG